MTGVQLADGEIVPREAGFVRPAWTPAIDYLDRPGFALTPTGSSPSTRAGAPRSRVSTRRGLDPARPGTTHHRRRGGAHAAAMLNRDLLGPLCRISPFAFVDRGARELASTCLEISRADL